MRENVHNIIFGDYATMIVVAKRVFTEGGTVFLRNRRRPRINAAKLEALSEINVPLE